MVAKAHAPEREVTLAQQFDTGWWLETADNPEPPAWFTGSKKAWLQRNFLHNFRRYVVGVSHLHRISVGSMTETGNAFRQPRGHLWGVTFAPWRPWLPYYSYRWRNKENTLVYDCAIGWSSFGMLMLKLRKMTPKSLDWE